MFWILRIIIIIAILASLATLLFNIGRGDKGSALPKVKALGLIGFLTAVLFLSFSFKQVDEGYVSIPVNLGRAGAAAPAGININWPWVDWIDLSVREQVLNFSGDDPADEAEGLDDITIQTRGGGGFDLDARVRIRLPEDAATDIWKDLGSNYVSAAVIPASRECLRDSAVDLDLTEAITVARPQIASKSQTCLEGKLGEYGLNVVSVELGGTDIPEAVQQAINAKQAAEQERQAAETKLRTAEVNARKQAVDAKGTSDAEQIIACGGKKVGDDLVPNEDCEDQFSQEYLDWLFLQNMKEVDKMIVVDPRLSDNQIILND